VDSGEYRIVYDVTEDAVRIIIVGKRNDDEVYRLLDRKR
jgi:mRNA interferase RelE/StbE